MRCNYDGPTVRRRAGLFRLLRDLPQFAIAWLARLYILRFPSMLLENFYIVKGEAVFTPRVGQLPWPVALALGIFSRKHVFGSGKQLDLKLFRHSAKLFRRLLAWSWCFRDCADASSPCTKLVRTEVKPFEGSLPHLLKNFADSVSSRVLAKVLEASRKIRSGLYHTRRPPRFLRWSIAWLAPNSWTVSQCETR